MTASVEKNRNEATLTKKSTATNSLLAGALAGAICTITCSPLDVTKVRLQIQGSLRKEKYTGNLINIGKIIYLEEGIRGFFRGIGPALCTIPLFWGIYWGTYDHLKVQLEYYLPENQHIKHTLAAIGAGAVGDVITNPLWVVRTRIQTLALHTEPAGKQVQVPKALDVIRSLYRVEGFRSFYRGLGASFLGLSHVAIQFPLYEFLKETARERNNVAKESTMDIIAASVFSKLVASSISYPHEVLRARLQDQRNASGQKSLGVFSMARKIVADEGISALWTGIRVNIIRMLPSTMSTFLSYEYISRWLAELK